MQFTDGSPVMVFGPEHERPQPPGEDESWQESFVIYWYDPRHRVGGGFRLASEPNHHGGRSQFLVMLLTPQGAWRRVDCLPARRDGVRTDGFVSGDGTLAYRFDGETIHWEYAEGDMTVSLSVERDTPAIDAHRRAGIAGAEQIMSAHIDAPARVRGKMRVAGKSWDIDGFGVRDHAWGKRNLGALRAHRWLVADMGEEDGKRLSFVAMTFVTPDGSGGEALARFGWLVRGETVALATHVETTARVGDDGLTANGGDVVMTLDSGEVVSARFEPLYPPFALGFTFIDAAYYTDAYCRVDWGDRRGFGIFEASSNRRAGVLEPRLHDGAIGSNGFDDHVRPLLGEAEQPARR